MSRPPRTARLPLLLVLLLLSSCQTPFTPASVSSKSSLLAVDVRFPARLSRDEDLVQAFFVRGPIHDGVKEIPELIPATFVKRSRAYLLDPEPGTYSLVAVTSAVAAPLSAYPVAGGVTKSTLPGTISNAVIFPADLIHPTRISIGRGGVAFMGALQVRRGEKIKAKTVFQDYVQKRIAERVRPDATTKSGIAGWFTRAWTVDLEETSFSREAADQVAFFDEAVKDLGESAWAGVVAREPPSEATIARASAPAASSAIAPKSAPRIDPKSTPELTPLSAPQSSTPAPPPTPRSATSEPEIAAPVPEFEAPGIGSLDPPPVAAIPKPAPPDPKRRRFEGLPPESPLSKIEFGMAHDEVRKIMGAPDERINRTTRKAWIPFYTGPGAYMRDWIYEGQGRVVFSLHQGSLEVLDVVYDPDAGK